LPWIEGGEKLWNFIKKNKPKILTGIPNGKWAEPQKREWCKSKLGSDVHVITCFSRHKHNFCKVKGSILIDDRESFKEKWEKAGGTFVHHTNTDDSISKLNDIFAKQKEKIQTKKQKIEDEITSEKLIESENQKTLSENKDEGSENISSKKRKNKEITLNVNETCEEIPAKKKKGIEQYFKRIE